MSRTRVGLALSGAAILLACGGVAAAATGAPSTGPNSGVPTVSASPTPTASPTSEDEDEPGDDIGEDEGAEDADTDDGGDPGRARTGGVGPDAAGPAHHGLCTAWSHVKDTPGKAAQSTAFRNVQQVDCSDVVPKQKGTTDDEGKGSKASKDKPAKDKPAGHKPANDKSSKDKKGSHAKG